MEEAKEAGVLYNIPAPMVATYRQSVIVPRARSWPEIAEVLTPQDPERISYVQLLALDGDVDQVADWEVPVPIDLVMGDIEAEYPLLYNWSSLPGRQPVRVTVPVVPGFGKAVRLAASLGFSVKLEVTQPGPPLIEEMRQALQFYLHNPRVVEPVEYFHSTLLAFHNEDPATLWEIQEEHPAYFRYVTEDGKATISRRFAGTELSGDLGTFPERLKADLLREGAECCDCECLEVCAGYFKWPRRDYRCDGVRGIFRVLQEAAEELKGDAAAFHAQKKTTDEE